jgi:UDPglucose 6-dehydrogenase/GDP-mannose 6-dehydrogenase
VEVAVLGLAFRPGTSDMRESPAVPVIHRLLADGARVSAYDPAARDEAARTFANSTVRLCPDLGSAVARADAVVVMTRWDEFRSLPDVLRASGRNPLVVDGRRMLDRRSCERYEGIGL